MDCKEFGSKGGESGYEDDADSYGGNEDGGNQYGEDEYGGNQYGEDEYCWVEGGDAYSNPGSRNPSQCIVLACFVRFLPFATLLALDYLR